MIKEWLMRGSLVRNYICMTLYGHVVYKRLSDILIVYTNILIMAYILINVSTKTLYENARRLTG